MIHRHRISSLEEGKYFNSVWLKLPDEPSEFLRKILIPIRQLCNWCVFYDDSWAHNNVHISLLYLGYDSKDLRVKMKQDIPMFKKIVCKHVPLRIHLKNISIWKKIIDGRIIQATLEWKFVDKELLKEFHYNLLQIPGYDFFEELEGKNFNPHITLGELNLNLENALSKSQKYLENIHQTHYEYDLYKVELNFSSEDLVDSFSISLT